MVLIMNDQSILNNILPTKEVLLDINSFVRNSCAAVGSCPRFIKISGLVAGVASVLDARRLIHEAGPSYAHAAEINDRAGLAKARINHATGYFVGFSGLGQLGASVPPRFDLSLRALGGLSASAPAAHLSQCFGVIAGVGTLLLSVSIVFSVCYEWSTTSLFRKNLKDILQTDRDQKEKVLEALEFLKQQFVLTQGEVNEILGQDLDPAVREATFQKKTSVKTEAFIRGIGLAKANEVIQGVDGLIDNVNANQEGALLAAQELIQGVDRESFKQRVQQITKLATGVLITAGTIVSFTLTGPISPILFGVNNVLCLSSDSSWLRDKIASGFYPSAL
jgi:hypothetical protein